MWLGLSADTFPSIGVIVFWMALLGAAELLPVSLGFGTEVTMGFPIHIALAIVFRDEPFAAMTIAALGTLDLREFRRQIALHNALFNRALMALSVGAAILPLALFDRDPLSHPEGVLLIILAAFLHLAVDLGLVVIAISQREHVSVGEVFQSQLPRPVAGFVASYALLTGIGVIAAVADDVGKWAVAAILIPLFFARLSIIGARAQQELAERLQHQQAALLEATESVFKERELERHRIAADMHDSTLQSLAAASYASSNALDFLQAGQMDAAKDALAKTHTAVEQSISELRHSLADLRQTSMQEGGLMESIALFSEQISTLWGASVRLEGGVDREPPIPVALAALQIVQEGVTNALKHSDKNAVVVKISEVNGMVRLEVEDDGPGFDPDSVVDSKHLGVQLMRERATSVGGELRFEAIPGGGTRVRAILPAGVQR